MKDDGGPAYPLQGENCYVSGMTLRDWFAGQALSHRVCDEPGHCHTMAERPKHPSPCEIAGKAYLIADAMIAEKRRREAEEATPDEIL